MSDETPNPENPPAAGPAPTRARTGGAVTVASGILLSRILGVLRESTLAHYFGVSAHSDAFTAALRVPNALQNLLGEGALSAAFIPIYSRLLQEGKEEEAGRFAGAIFGLMLATASALALLGIALAPALVFALAPGYLHDAARVAAGEMAVDRFALCVHAVRILFPMTGLLVLSVWALAVLNSHRRFFLPYFAPVLWNSSMIGALILVGRWVERSQGASAAHLGTGALTRLFYAACWGGLVGGLLQFLVQLPGAFRVLRGFRLSFSTRVPGVRQALKAWGPVVAGRGVVQLAGYMDLFLATLLAVGAQSADRFAQMPYILPISLFGVSVAASELPELSRLQGQGAEGELVSRVRRMLGAMAFLNVPTVIGYLVFGYLVIGFLYRSGNFTVGQNWLVYFVLCGYSLGILATTSSRLLQNTFYALGEAKVPARIAVQRVLTSIAVALPLMFWLDRFPLAAVIGGSRTREALFLGAVGLSTASAVGAWSELLRLRRALRRRLPGFDLPWKEDGKMILCALAAALPGALVWWRLPAWPVRGVALIVLAVYAVSYFAVAKLAGLEELDLWLGGFLRRLGRLRRRRS
jgi:putative peptidoglycan lipid II flippase